MRKLTPGMLAELRHIESAPYSDSDGYVMARNENSGKAIANRGLVDAKPMAGGWNRYRLTDAGKAALREATAE